MIQQVNLLPEKLGRHTGIGFNSYLLSIALSCAAMIGVSSYNGYQLNSLETQSLQLQQQLQRLTAQVSTLQAPNPQNDALFNQELQQSQALYQSLAQVVELLADKQTDQTQGFSRYLAALAGQSDPSVWLNRITIDAVGNDIELQGSSFKPEQIPYLLQRLQTTSAFKGRHFARLGMRQSEKAEEQIDFTVSSNLNPVAEATDAKQP